MRDIDVIKKIKDIPDNLEGRFEKIESKFSEFEERIEEEVESKISEFEERIEEDVESKIDEIEEKVDSLEEEIKESIEIEIEEVKSKVDVLEVEISNLEPISTKVTRPNGKTVEESILENETEITKINHNIKGEEKKFSADKGFITVEDKKGMLEDFYIEGRTIKVEIEEDGEENLLLEESVETGSGDMLMKDRNLKREVKKVKMILPDDFDKSSKIKVKTKSINDGLHRYRDLSSEERESLEISSKGAVLVAFTFELLEVNKDIVVLEIVEGETDNEVQKPYLLSVGQKEGINIFIRDDNNKNLFYGENELGYLQLDGTKADSESSIRTKNFIKVNANTTYSISNDKNYTKKVFFYSIDKTFIDKKENIDYFTTSEDCHFIKVCTDNTLNQNDLSTKWQLEEGEKRTDYIEPKYEIINIKETFRSLPKDVKDNLEKLDGKYYKIQKTEELTLDDRHFGDFVKTEEKDIVAIGLFLSLDESVLKDDFNYVIGTDNFYCNNLKSYRNKEDMQNKEGARLSYFANKNRPILVINLSKNKIEKTPESVKKWLKENPITIVYELKTPIKTEIEKISRKDIDNKTTLVIETGELSSKFSFSVRNGLENELTYTKEEVEDLKDRILKLEQLIEKSRINKEC